MSKRDAFTVLHLGCGRVGHSLTLTAEDGAGTHPIDLITLDRDPMLEPNIVCDLGVESIPLGTDSVDLAVAIHVLEHIGRQGETRAWFYFWEELYRVLKPNARLRFETPLWTSVWSWGDPSHTRAMSEQAFCFFDQNSYRLIGSPISPYRIRCDFVAERMQRVPDATLLLSEGERVSTLRGALMARKPLRPWWDDETQTANADAIGVCDPVNGRV